MKKDKLEEYEVVADRIPVRIEIVYKKEDLVPRYIITLPSMSPATSAVLENIHDNLVKTVALKESEILDPRKAIEVKEKFRKAAVEMITKEIPGIDRAKAEILVGILLQEMLGLGNIEFLLADGNLEEIVINSSSETIWVYHKKYGWVKTNIVPPSEEYTENIASSIGRRVGRQITTLDPLLDAHLITGDRVNATLFPITTKGNTLTIRKFRRDPWTIVGLIQEKTVNLEVAALLWLCMQYEMSFIVSGGTASGKTTFLNSLMPFIPPNHRIISIEQTRELTLPDFLHWIPMTTREPNPEGKGEVSMLDLMVNSLRMRPDRIVVGEVRRAAEAEVLFEAMRTGHSVYATLHADTADQTFRRLTTPPINLPEASIEALPLVVVMIRDRRKSLRRIFQIAEVVPTTEREGEVSIKMSLLYRWRPRVDVIAKHADSVRLYDELRLHTGMTDEEIENDLKEKMKVLEWMVKNNITTINAVGKVIASYYANKEDVLKAIESGSPKEILGEFLKELK